MIIEDLMIKVYRMFEKSTDAPDKTSEDYLVRLAYVNSSIDEWENAIGMDWKELSGTISGTLVDGVFDLTTITDFKAPDGFVVIGTDTYEYKRPEVVEQEVRLDSNKKIYTVTGSEGSYSLRVYPAISDSFTLNYKKTAAKYSTGSETEPIQMSNPYYIIHRVMTNLYLDDDNTNQASVENQIAESILEAMKTANETVPSLQDSTFSEDNQAIIFGQ